MHQTTTPSTRQGLLMFFALLAGYTAFAANWVAGSSLGGHITEHYFAGQEVPSVVKQVVNYSITIARIFANFLAAFVLLRLGIKRAASLAVVLLLFALVAIWMPNYYLYVLSRMIMAVGASMVMVYMNPVVSRFVARDQKVVFSTLITLSYNVGAFVVALAFAFWLDAMHHNWQLTMTAFSSIFVLVALFWFAVAADFDTGASADSVPENYGYRQALADSFNWTFALGFAGFLFLYVMALTTYPAVLPKHLPLLHTGWITLAVAGGGIAGAFLGTVAGRQPRPRRPMCALFGSLMIGFMLLGFLLARFWAPASYVCLFLSGFFMFSQYSIFLNMPHELPNMNPQKVTLIFGVIWALAYSFYTLFNILWSFVLDHLGWNASMVFYFGLSSLYLLALIRLPETYRLQ